MAGARSTALGTRFSSLSGNGRLFVFGNLVAQGRHGAHERNGQITNCWTRWFDFYTLLAPHTLQLGPTPNLKAFANENRANLAGHYWVANSLAPSFRAFIRIPSRGRSTKRHIFWLSGSTPA